MNEWVCICKATEDDEKRLLERQKAFLDRHNYMKDVGPYLHYDPKWDNMEQWILLWCHNYYQIFGCQPPEYWAYWKMVARALGHKDARGIAWGYIGHPAK